MICVVSKESCEVGHTTLIPVSLKYRNVADMRLSLFLENLVRVSRASHAELRLGVLVRAHNLETVDRPAAEFFELREHSRSRSHRSGIPAERHSV